MNYLGFIWGDGLPAPEAMAVMQDELPGWIEEMDRRGVRLVGRELDHPDTAVTVCIRDGETLVSDGPFAETKEFIAGFDLLACADLDEAIEVMASSPVCRFHPIEIRPLVDGLRLGENVSAFAREDDSAGTPYLLSQWLRETPAAPHDDQAVMQECEAWRRDLEVGGLHILGNAVKGADTATTVRVHDGETRLTDGPFLDVGGVIVGIDVVSCADRQQAIDLAATHPFARYHVIEVRPFYSEAVHAQRQLES